MTELIKACREYGVDEIKFEGIEIKFKKEVDEKDEDHSTRSFIDPQAFPIHAVPTEVPALSQKEIEEKQRLIQALEDQMIAVEDPLEWERQELEALSN